MEHAMGLRRRCRLSITTSKDSHGTEGERERSGTTFKDSPVVEEVLPTMAVHGHVQGIMSGLWPSLTGG